MGQVSDRFIEELCDIDCLTGPDLKSYCIRMEILIGQVIDLSRRNYNSDSNCNRNRALLFIMRDKDESKFWNTIQYMVKKCPMLTASDDFENLLNSEGYSYNQGLIISMTGSIPYSRPSEALLTRKLREAGITEDFLRQIKAADQDFSRGDDNGAVSKYRVVLDQILKELAQTIRKNFQDAMSQRINYGIMTSVIEFLKRNKLLDSNETKLITALYSMMSENGSHQYAWVTTRSLTKFIAVIISSLLLFLVERLIDFRKKVLHNVE